jgi:hypothetical protein
VHAHRGRVHDELGVGRLHAPGIEAIGKERTGQFGSELFGGFDGAVDNDDAEHAPGHQRADDTARRAAGTDDDGLFQPVAPARRLLVEVGEEAVVIGVGAMDRDALGAIRGGQGIEGADVRGVEIAGIAKLERGFLVRHGDVAADEFAGADAIEKRLEVVGSNIDRLIAAGNAIGFCSQWPWILGEREWAIGWPITKARFT